MRLNFNLSDIQPAVPRICCNHCCRKHLRVCLIGTNYENGRLGRPGICLIDSQIPKTAGLAGLEGLLNDLLQQAEGWQTSERFSFSFAKL